MAKNKDQRCYRQSKNCYFITWTVEKLARSTNGINLSTNVSPSLRKRLREFLCYTLWNGLSKFMASPKCPNGLRKYSKFCIFVMATWWFLRKSFADFSEQRWSLLTTARWGWFNQTCKRHGKDYHGIVVHTLGGHNPLSLKSYKFKIKKIKQMQKFKMLDVEQFFQQ